MKPPLGHRVLAARSSRGLPSLPFHYDAVDAWLLQQDKLVNASLRAVYPVVQQRTELANAFSRRLALLGLEREPWSG